MPLHAVVRRPGLMAAWAYRQSGGSPKTVIDASCGRSVANVRYFSLHRERPAAYRARAGLSTSGDHDSIRRVDKSQSADTKIRLR